MQPIIECVPNFSEGRNQSIIDQITSEIQKIPGVRLIDVDPGAATNRTVVTFVGHPDAVVEAAFQCVKKARELIDMRHHKGAHPRFGATDVCPLIPVSHITMEEVTVYAHKLAQRIGESLSIPVYCYESAAFEPKRKNLAACREGEYEKLAQRLTTPEWKPDFGPSEWTESVARSGAIAVGARNFLIAYNVNLNTTSTRRANSLAFDVRERGRALREGDPISGKLVKDEKGQTVYAPGLLKSVKAIGWFIEEYGIAQISMNLTDIEVTPLHVAFDAVVDRAHARGMRVTGSELVGVLPLQAMLDAGKYFLRKQNRSVGISEHEIVQIAIKSLGLNELYPFDPDKKIIEYILRHDTPKKLVHLTAEQFAQETSSESPAPGGGSIAAYLGALGVSLGTMVANLSAHKRGWDDRWEFFSNWAEQGMQLQKELLALVDDDTLAFNRIMAAFDLPKASDTEKAARKQAIQNATRNAIEIPFKVMQTTLKTMTIIQVMAEQGNPNSVSDAGVGALCARSAVRGAFLNVKINASGLDDREYAAQKLREGSEIEAQAMQLEQAILETVNQKIG